MKRNLFFALVLLASLATAAWAGRTGGAYDIRAESVDNGGRTVASANYSIDGSLGAIGGVATGTVAALKAGYVGQLTDVTGLSVTATPASVNEGATTQLGGAAVMDDATITPLAPGETVWLAASPAVTGINGSGLLTAGTVCTATWVRVDGACLGVTGTARVLVLNSDPDNYGIYAGDGIPDAWQVRYFGVDNPVGLASATNCTGRSNLYSYTADLDPTDPASVFEIVAVSNQPPNRVLYFKTTSAARVYRLQYSTNLVAGSWANLPGQVPAPGQAGQMSLSDTNTAAPRFYRVQVGLP